MNAFDLARKLYATCSRLQAAQTVTTAKRTSTVDGESFHIQVTGHTGRVFSVEVREVRR